MARLASVAVAGYFPTPPELLPAIARLVAPSPGLHGDAWVDPCAGRGEAIVGLLECLYGVKEAARLRVWTCELEATRFEDLKTALRPYEQRAWGHFVATHGDALRLTVGRAVQRSGRALGASVLYLNPPYDLDSRFRRLEERFLQRFVPCLAEDGVLLFVVPGYALTASAETLSRYLYDLDCTRFPGASFDVFKQVVLRGRARRTPLDAALPEDVARIRAWASSAEQLPELGDDRAPYILPVPPVETNFRGEEAPGEYTVEWTQHPVDLDAVRASHAPWSVTAKGGKRHVVEGVFPSTAVGALALRFPMAVVPKPAHLAAGIAAGLFNGETLSPDDKDSPAPPVVVKGVFSRVWTPVEERRATDGTVTGTVEVEEPSLAITALDLQRSSFATLTSAPEPTGATDPAKMSSGDLLTQYGVSLLTTMRAHCPVTHDPHNPAHVIPLVQGGRPLYTAQAHAAMAVVKLLGGAAPTDRRGRFAFLVGEVGSGKTGVFQVVGQTVRARTVLVLCPPHLVASWRDETAVVWPEAQVVELDSIAAVDALIERRRREADLARRGQPLGPPVLAVLTRETAKLGHAWVSVPRCGECGAKAPPGDHATSRGRCPAPVYANATAEDRLAETLAHAFRGHLDGLPGRRTVSRQKAVRLAVDALRPVNLSDAARLALSLKDPHARLACARDILSVDSDDLAGEALLMSVPPSTPGWSDVWELTRTDETERTEADLLRRFAAALAGEGPEVNDRWCRWGNPRVAADGVYVSGHLVGGIAHANAVLPTYLRRTPVRVCNAPLFAASPSPRRYPLAQYIVRRARGVFDLIGIDEAHEYGSDGSAQERAAHRLTGLGAPVVLLTGSLVNGYAEHLFANLWALSRRFREVYPRSARGAFAKKYGYSKRFVPTTDGDKRRDRGAVTDRVDGPRSLGSAPGVQPVAVLEWVLPWAVTLHKADLNLDLPELTVTRVPVTPSAAQIAVHRPMLAALVAQVRKDSFTALQGALWGQLSEAPSHLDRMTADVGNTEDGSWVVQYPEHHGAAVVHRAAPLSEDTILPKEEWMLGTVDDELKNDRPVIICARHLDLFPRYAKLIRDRLGAKVAVLDAAKVSASKRQAWIKKQTASGVRVLLTNPVAIQTGLNCLTYFATEIWMENPNCDAIVYRQAVGRIDRIGQTKPPRVFFPVYEDTVQAPLHALLLAKVAVSQSTDGLDARSALQASGVGESRAMSSLSVGRVLFGLLDSPDGRRLYAAMRGPRNP